MERYELVIERIRACLTEETVGEPYLSYFRKVASFILSLREVSFLKEQGIFESLRLEEHKHINDGLYQELLPPNYETSYLNPAYAVQILGNYGQYLSFLYAEIRGTIPEAYEQDMEALTIYYELFVEIYNLFEYAHEEGGLPSIAEINDVIYWFVSDNCDICVELYHNSQVREELNKLLSEMAYQNFSE